MERKPVLSVRNLTTSFLVDGAWKSVVRDVSFDVAPGETVAIVGESGSGKSVTSLSLMRLLPEAIGSQMAAAMEQRRGGQPPAEAHDGGRAPAAAAAGDPPRLYCRQPRSIRRHMMRHCSHTAAAARPIGRCGARVAAIATGCDVDLRNSRRV